MNRPRRLCKITGEERSFVLELLARHHSVDQVHEQFYRKFPQASPSKVTTWRAYFYSADGRQEIEEVRQVLRQDVTLRPFGESASRQQVLNEVAEDLLNTIREIKTEGNVKVVDVMKIINEFRRTLQDIRDEEKLLGTSSKSPAEQLREAFDAQKEKEKLNTNDSAVN